MFIFEVQVPTKDKQQTISILKSAGYNPVINRDSIEVNLNQSGEKKFLQRKLKDAGIYFEILQEESLASKIKKLKKRIAIISKNKKAQNDWDEWASKYDFSFTKADSYDLANAKARVDKIIKDRKLEPKMKEDALDQVFETPDLYDKYEMIYKGIQDNTISFEEFVQIVGAIKSNEGFAFTNKESLEENIKS